MLFWDVEMTPIVTSNKAKDLAAIDVGLSLLKPQAGWSRLMNPDRGREPRQAFLLSAEVWLMMRSVSCGPPSS